jgi:hypothetical protein
MNRRRNLLKVTEMTIEQLTHRIYDSARARRKYMRGTTEYNRYGKRISEANKMLVNKYNMEPIRFNA